MRHNRLYALGQKTYEMGLNKYSDLTEKEYASLRGTHVPGNNNDGIEFNRTAAVRYIGVNSVLLPQSINWTEIGAVTEIKDQGKELVFSFFSIFFLVGVRAALFLFDIYSRVWLFGCFVMSLQ